MNATATKTWECQYFGSGTTIVTQCVPRQPHYYIYGPRNEGDERAETRDRFRTCEQIRDFLNGGDRPAWLDDMERRDEISAEGLDGTSIFATGPSIDRDPPNLDWIQDDSDEAKSARARLMDLLFLNL
jgi:hypothetical protein